MQQSIIQFRTDDLYAFRQDEGPLELPCGDSTMKKFPVGIIDLSPADDQLRILDRDGKSEFTTIFNARKDLASMKPRIRST